MKLKALIVTIIFLLQLISVSCSRGSASFATMPYGNSNPILTTTIQKDGISVPNQFIIKRKGLAYLVSDQGLQQQLGITILKSNQTFGIDLITARPEVINQIKSNPQIEYVEPNYIRQIDSPNISSSAPQNSGVTAQASWKINPGRNYITIGVLDTGIDLNHPDLVKKLVPGYNNVVENAREADDNGHGTLLSGLIVGANTSMGIASLAPECKLMPVKVLNQDGTGTDFNIIDGIVWAVEHGAKVILLPVNGTYQSKALSDALVYAFQNNVPVVVPVGDKGQAAKYYPASESGIIAVNALDATGQIANFSNKIQGTSVSAYGVNRVSTFPTYNVSLKQMNSNSGYGMISGTSAAAAEVSALMGLIFSQYPNAPFSEARRILEMSSDRLNNPAAGYGKINPVKALTLKNSNTVQANRFIRQY